MHNFYGLMRNVENVTQLFATTLNGFQLSTVVTKSDFWIHLCLQCDTSSRALYFHVDFWLDVLLIYFFLIIMQCSFTEPVLNEQMGRML